ncbi:MAG: hypothetical protein K2L86_01790 [Lachnospiraceae bacterium]|nr:hypothetical protein [Lachnospiraceae bacterium]
MDYNKLTFTNNFVFCKVLENNLDLCRQLLELILGVKIKKVELALFPTAARKCRIWNLVMKQQKYL